MTFGCVNTAAPGDGPAAEAADKDKDAAGKEPASGTGLVRTWALRMKGEEKILAMAAALEKAKAQHCLQDGAAAKADDNV